MSDLVYAQREIDNLINLLADARTENMKLRAALELIADGKETEPRILARAMLEGK